MKRGALHDASDVLTAAEATSYSTTVLEALGKDNTLNVKHRKLIQEAAELLAKSAKLTKEYAQRTTGNTALRVLSRQQAHARRTAIQGPQKSAAPKGSSPAEVKRTRKISPEKPNGSGTPDHLSSLRNFNQRLDAAGLSSADKTASVVKKSIRKGKKVQRFLPAPSSKKASKLLNPLEVAPGIFIEKPAMEGRYSAAEVAELLSKLPRVPTAFQPSKAQVIAALSGHSLVAQRKKAHLYRLVALFDQGDVVPAWGTAGRKPVMDLDAVKAFVESFTAQGASITREDWRAQLKKAAAASSDANADCTLLYGRGWEPNRHTIDQYMQLSLEWGEKTNENKVPEKSMQRIMAESSVISMMSNAIATTYSLVRICEEGCALNPPPPGNDIARYWAKVYGVSTKCLDLLDPALVSNTDGTTRFVYEGKDKKGDKDNWVISPKDGAGLTSARSTFTTGTTTPTNGLRVELLFSFDAAGGAAPLCALVSLNERECSGLKIVQVPVGLSPYDTNLGTVMFIGPSNGEEPNETPAVLAAKHYHAVVLQNWYRAKRRARGNIDNLKIAAAMTGVTQPDDLMAVFRLITHLAKFMEASDTKVSKVLKAHLLTEFRKIDGLNLSTVKMNALVDFLATLPQILAKAVTPTHIENGFFRAGWFSDTESGWPTLDGFFNQLRQKLTEEEKARCRSNFVELASVHRDQGYIDDAEYEALNFPTDKHPIDGREIRRNSHAPHLMRGMTFGHLALQKEREE